LHFDAMTTQAVFHQAEERIRRTGARVTVARVRVLAFLLTQQDAVPHHQIEVALDQYERIDRVTLYRTLDWLTEAGLVHKVAGVDRAWRFRINENDIAHHQHAHFKCNHCAKVICLDDVGAGNSLPALPDGYRGLEIELTVKGLCAQCA
jgi:Fur family ferric uptake transcriptional regulator